MWEARKPTIHDVARLAGTSATTVSRVLNRKGYPVSSRLRERVEKAVEETGYSPNMMARNLKTAESDDIGVVVPNISNPFYSLVILGMERELKKQGYNLLLCNSFRDSERERGYLQSLYEKQVHGVIISTAAQNHDNVSAFMKKGMRFVLLDQSDEKLSCPYIRFDAQRGARLGTEYLISQGHRRILFASTPLTRWSRKKTYDGFLEAHENAGLPPGPTLIENEREEEVSEQIYENQAGISLARKYLKAQDEYKATAVFCVNDMVAFGFIQELSAKGKKVPRDISVMGFDNLPFAGMFSPPLTTVHVPAVQMGSMAASMLLDDELDGGSGHLGVMLEPQLIVRASVGTLD